MAEAGPGELRYKAFLSYSHKDSAVAARLHRRLESYRLPRRLVGSEGARGPVPERLWPIFRDREELPAATDLSETVRAALAESASLIVLCSPHAAASLWVGEEIETFRRLYPERPVLAAIVDGEPGECFPAALRAFGQDGTWHEPLATDLRPEGDGPQLGLLKLVAGITGIGLDALVQRDAQRRIRRVTAVSVTALLALLLMTGLTVFALDARAEAERQRAEAQGLIEFMLTDLRDRLRGVGRLDIMGAANQQALAYYARQPDQNSVDSLMRARVLHALGEDDLEAGRQELAGRHLHEAFRRTAARLAQFPNDPQAIFAHGQSEYWVGFHSYFGDDVAGARSRFENYRRLAHRLVSIDPTNASWWKERAYAEGNICALMTGEENPQATLNACFRALTLMERAARLSRNISAYRSDLANRHADVGDALRAAGRLDEALQHHQRRLAYLDRQLIEDPSNLRLMARRVWALRAIANVQARLGQYQNADDRMNQAQQGIDALVQLDPRNADWRTQQGRIREELVRIRQRSFAR